MGTKELKALMAELEKACHPYGRQKEVAKELGSASKFYRTGCPARECAAQEPVQDRGFPQKAEEPPKIDALGMPKHLALDIRQKARCASSRGILRSTDS